MCSCWEKLLTNIQQQQQKKPSKKQELYLHQICGCLYNVMY